MRVALCADVGSTFTKVAAVDIDDGALLASAEHRTTANTDVLHGLDAAIARVNALLPGAADVGSTYVCSSAGGGLRLAVVGYEPLVTAEAGHRVGLSAGARVVHVAGGRLDRAGIAALRQARPDLVLLVGGTDGGDDEVLRHNAARLAGARLAARKARVPIVVAGNIDARDDVTAVLRDSGAPVVGTDNVLPRIGELHPGPARGAIREVFLHHVIGGKGLSRGPRFASLVCGATPDVVLTAVELLAKDLGGELAVVDVGGATTDVYSVLNPDPALSPDPGTRRGRLQRPDRLVSVTSDVAGTLWHSRTVEGDLGMRWSAPGVVAAATPPSACSTPMKPGHWSWRAAARAENPSMVPQTDSEQWTEARIAQLAATIALRRHARATPAGRRHPPAGGAGRKDLRRVRLVIGSGGVLRHAPTGVGQRALTAVLADRAGGWLLPLEASVAIDHRYVLAPAGLLAADHPEAALALLRTLCL